MWTGRLTKGHVHFCPNDHGHIFDVHGREKKALVPEMELIKRLLPGPFLTRSKRPRKTAPSPKLTSPFVLKLSLGRGDLYDVKSLMAV